MGLRKFFNLYPELFYFKRWKQIKLQKYFKIVLAAVVFEHGQGRCSKIKNI